MSADRRKRAIVAMIVDDPYRKLVAIGLAVLLWFFIDSRIMASKTLTLPLRQGDQVREQEVRRDSSELVIYLKPGRVAARRFLAGDQVITNIDVKFSGPRYKIDALTENPPRLEVMTFLDRQWNRAVASAGSTESLPSESDIQIVEFTAADIARDIRRDDVTIELIPPRVRLEVQIRDSYVVPVTNDMVDFGSHQADGRLRLQEATYLPRQMTLVGPAIGIRKLEAMTKKFRAELEYGPLDQEVRALLTVIDGANLGVYPEVSPSQVTIPLNPERKTHLLTLPLQIQDRRRDQSAAYEPAKLTEDVHVSFSGRLGREIQSKSKEARQVWAEQNMRLEVYLQEPFAGQTYGPELQLPPFLVLDGPVAQMYPNNEYLLEESLTVTVRVKK